MVSSQKIKEELWEAGIAEWEWVKNEKAKKVHEMRD
jgi:hypothetical protein